MTNKEQQILVEVLLQLNSLASHLIDNYQAVESRKLDKIIDQLTTIFNQTDD